MSQTQDYGMYVPVSRQNLIDQLKSAMNDNIPKLDCIFRVFMAIASPIGRKLLATPTDKFGQKFARTCRQKLIEFYLCEKVLAARTFHKKVFGYDFRPEDVVGVRPHTSTKGAYQILKFDQMALDVLRFYDL